jgi:hypothetical protein
VLRTSVVATVVHGINAGTVNRYVPAISRVVLVDCIVVARYGCRVSTRMKERKLWIYLK